MDEPLNYIEWHRPNLYRYRVAHPGIRIGWNRYPGVKIGAYVVIGQYAYCIKWGWARVARSGT